MLKKIVKYLKKLRPLIFKESYLVLCTSEADMTVTYYKLLHYIRETYGWNYYLASPSCRWIKTLIGWKVVTIQFVSVRSNSYIATQVAHQGKTVSGKMVTDYIESHKEKSNANT